MSKPIGAEQQTAEVEVSADRKPTAPEVLEWRRDDVFLPETHGNTEAGFIFGGVVRPLEPAPPEYVTLSMRPASDREFVALAVEHACGKRPSPGGASSTWKTCPSRWRRSPTLATSTSPSCRGRARGTSSTRRCCTCCPSGGTGICPTVSTRDVGLPHPGRFPGFSRRAPESSCRRAERQRRRESGPEDVLQRCRRPSTTRPAPKMHSPPPTHVVSSTGSGRGFRSRRRRTSRRAGCTGSRSSRCCARHSRSGQTPGRRSACYPRYGCRQRSR